MQPKYPAEFVWMAGCIFAFCKDRIAHLETPVKAKPCGRASALRPWNPGGAGLGHQDSEMAGSTEKLCILVG